MACSRASQRAPRISSWASLSHTRREHPAVELPYAFLQRRDHRTGERRLRPPEPHPPYEGIHYAQAYGKSCPQQELTLPNGLDSTLVKNIGNVVNRLYEDLTPADEDC